jgi:hypothetical protein
MSFDQVLYELSKVSSNTFINMGYLPSIIKEPSTGDKTNILDKYPNVFSQIQFDKFIQGINIHWVQKIERKICRLLLDRAIQIQNTDLIFKPNPDIIIKEFCSHMELSKPISTVCTNTSGLVICGDINMFIICSGNTRIKKYSFKSSPEEDEPFNHLVQMQMHSSANDIIFAYN